MVHRKAQLKTVTMNLHHVHTNKTTAFEVYSLGTPTTGWAADQICRCRKRLFLLKNISKHS